MKRRARARRVLIAVTALMATISAVLMAANWTTVRDHVHAWHLQLTREIKMIEPVPGLQGMPLRFVGDTPADTWENLPVFLQRVANCTARPVIFAIEDDSPAVRVIMRGAMTMYSGALDVYGLRIVEQRFPGRAYVVVRDNEPPRWWNAPIPRATGESSRTERP